MADTIIESLQEYLQACPLLAGARLNVDFLPARPLEYMISPSPVDEVLRAYVHGSSLRQYVFVLASKSPVDEDVAQNLANSGFYEKMSAWMETQTRQRRFPALPAGKQPVLIEAMSTGYLMSATGTEGQYQIQCRLVYFQKGERNR